MKLVKVRENEFAIAKDLHTTLFTDGILSKEVKKNDPNFAISLYRSLKMTVNPNGEIITDSKEETKKAISTADETYYKPIDLIN